ncbi:MAG: S9 family peptidase [Lysobacterales bacterium]|nr:MAG: S9 family peptidase [Xanthomonadales bacterium]
MRQPLLVGARSFAEVHAYTWNEAEELLELKIPVALIDAFSGLTGVGTQLTLLLQNDWNVSGETFPSGARVAVDLARVIRQGGQPDGAVSLVYMPKENESLAGLFGSFTAAGDAIYLNVIEDVKSRIRRVAPVADGSWEVTALPLPGDGAASLPMFADPYTDSFLLRYENFLTPPALYRVDEGQSLQLLSQERSEIDLSGYVTEQFFAQASDGTSVPYFITRAIDRKPDASAPVLMYAYGGFGIPMIQNYELFYIGPTHRIWLEQGGVFVLANPRGGGEYGPRWHQAAKRTTRQTVYDDIYAVAEDIIKRGFSAPGRFGFIGGSNGGLTAGVVATQRPDLFGAAISLVPLLDMERYHLLLSGASWMDEYGNPEDPVEGPALLAYSPYHNLKPEVSYPEIFLLTSTRDDRVHPGHARKMAHKMQDMGHEVLFYEAREGGHAMAVDNEGRAFNAAMQAVYLMQKLME